MKTITFYLLLFSVVSLAAQDFNFLGGYDGQGVPDYLEPENDIISTESMQMIFDALPEGYPVPDYNPHYITAGYDTDLALIKDASIWVTFVKEGAGYKNVLGFYTYDLSDPDPAKPEASDITIIFPNASEGGYGGGLRKGNKVKMGDFPAGTGIGWVLLADAWDGKRVGNGLWQVFSNPEYNPEEAPDLKHHMVLLSDPENERIYLGIEDIRRDYASCDQDFNDAIFFVTANPYEAIKTHNYADIESSYDVSSGNNGGLESNGKLAQQIAQRNFNRLKDNTTRHLKTSQQKYQQQRSYARSYEDLDLKSVLPASGMTGTEEARISSPDDLLNITNAEAIFSADYYQGEHRVAAALSSKTKNRIYDHSKVICDRLNSSSLEDIRSIRLHNYDLVMIKMRRAGGQLEYAINFSINSDNELFSFWNITEYPTGNYFNFQVWGKSMGQVSSITRKILDRFQAINQSVTQPKTATLPDVFVKKGNYKDGQLHLTIKNTKADLGMFVSGSIRKTEFDSEVPFYQDQPLSGAYEEDITIAAGSLFDVGLSVQGTNSKKYDALYLADGPWGVDYDDKEAQIDDFSIVSTLNEGSDAVYNLERNVSIDGKVYGTLNLFRTLLPGDLLFDAENFKSLTFDIKNTLPVEVILVTENLTHWDNRYRFKLEPGKSLITKTLSLSDFSNANSNYKGERLKSIVFSVQGDYKSFFDFQLRVEHLAFTDKSLSIESFYIEEPLVANEVYNYPNPFKGATKIVIPENTKSAKVSIYDLDGKEVWSQGYETLDLENQLPVELPGVPSGRYVGIVELNESKEFVINLLIN